MSGSSVDDVVRPFALGMATGARSTAGIAAIAFGPSGSGGSQPLKALTSPWGKRLAGVALLGEVTGDKLPMTPSREQPQGLGGRVVGAVVSGAALAERDGGDAASVVGLVVAGSLLGTVVGSAWRSLAKRRGHADWPAALAEDAVTAVLAFVGASAARGTA